MSDQCPILSGKKSGKRPRLLWREGEPMQRRLTLPEFGYYPYLSVDIRQGSLFLFRIDGHLVPFWPIFLLINHIRRSEAAVTDDSYGYA